MSSVKSITGLLVGLLVADGKVALDDPVSRFVPEWADGRRGRVTVRHLLTMSSGLTRAVEPGKSVGFAADKTGFVVGLEPADEPGTRWEYSNEGVQLLSPILEKAAGMPLHDYARDRLFRPLGMNDTRLRLDAKGHAWTYADAETTLRDFARLGELMRNKGRLAGPAGRARVVGRSIDPPVPSKRGLWLPLVVDRRAQGVRRNGISQYKLLCFPRPRAGGRADPGPALPVRAPRTTNRRPSRCSSGSCRTEAATCRSKVPSRPRSPPGARHAPGRHEAFVSPCGKLMLSGSHESAGATTVGNRVGHRAWSREPAVK